MNMRHCRQEPHQRQVVQHLHITSLMQSAVDVAELNAVHVPAETSPVRELSEISNTVMPVNADKSGTGTGTVN